MCRRMHQQKFICFFTRLFAKIGQYGDVPADDCLKCSAQIPNHTSRTRHNPAHHSKISHDPVAWSLHCRGYHRRIHSSSHCQILLCVAANVLSFATFTAAILPVYKLDARGSPLCYSRLAWRHSSTFWQPSRSCSGSTLSPRVCSGLLTPSAVRSWIRVFIRHAQLLSVLAAASNNTWSAISSLSPNSIIKTLKYS